MDSLRTLRDFLRWGASRFAAAGVFFGHGTTGAADEAAVLIAHALHLDLPLAPEFMDAALTTSERAAVLALFERRVTQRLPAPYLTGEAWFAGLRFAVDPRVLIPRSPIAELIDRGFAPWFDDAPPARILDIGTGSGCIAIACALAFPDAQVDAVDISADALAVAQTNVTRYGLQDRMRLLRSDLYAALRGERYDLIVSNPPYVPQAEYAQLPVEYRHEPAGALLSPDEGLEHPLRILRGAAAHLTERGVLVLEVGATWPALAERLPDWPLLWLELERGGEGVALIGRDELQQALR
ncbi:MAG: 50S ribosomal protein L3 N(5)-glutamine methyltransferase [Immundisolibacter sp.]|uniref:50S ribosomal protein L3 N(5)-glutamine methyltransferase n=1 Tax=Immundisolibacter sp. TaxID=1934948 RepID=UPI003D0CFCB7